MFDEKFILPLTFIMGSISWRFILATHFFPNVKSWTTEQLLKPLVAIHLFRYVSLSLLIPGLTTVYEILPQSHIYRLAGGDFLCAIISMMALMSLHKNWKAALPLVMLLNAVGLLDLLLATLFDMPLLIQNVNQVDTRLFGVLTTFIPLVFVSHVFMVKILFDHWRKKG